MKSLEGFKLLFILIFNIISKSGKSGKSGSLESGLNFPENNKKINELVNSHSQLKEDLINIIEKKYVMLKTSELMRNNIAYQSFGDSDSESDRWDKN